MKDTNKDGFKTTCDHSVTYGGCLACYTKWEREQQTTKKALRIDSYLTKDDKRNCPHCGYGMELKTQLDEDSELRHCPYCKNVEVL